MSNDRSMKRYVRLRMAETGERYTVALRTIQNSQAEFLRLKEVDRQVRQRQRYPTTVRDGLDRRHILSAWETSRSSH